jgi:hypothetical protein
LSLFNNSRRTEIKQLETSTINSPNEKNEELKPLVVYDMASNDGITEADTSITTKKVNYYSPSEPRWLDVCFMLHRSNLLFLIPRTQISQYQQYL